MHSFDSRHYTSHNTVSWRLGCFLEGKWAEHLVIPYMPTPNPKPSYASCMSPHGPRQSVCIQNPCFLLWGRRVGPPSLPFPSPSATWSFQELGVPCLGENRNLILGYILGSPYFGKLPTSLCLAGVGRMASRFPYWFLVGHRGIEYRGIALGSCSGIP